MSIDERLRTGLGRNGDVVPVAVEASLDGVVRRHRSGVRRRIAGVVIAATTAIALAPWGYAQLNQKPQPAAPRSGLLGTYVVKVPASARAGMAGRWLITIGQDGRLTIDPPQNQAARASTDTYAVHGLVMETNALLGDCQSPRASLTGRYTWQRSNTTVTFVVVEDRCAARKALFAVPWTEQR